MDYPYAILYIILILFSFLYRNGNGKAKEKIAIGAIIIVFIFIAFRAPVVGADTYRYILYLTGDKKFNTYIDTDNRDVELLFPIYREVVCSITSSRLLVMIINTLIAFTPLFYLFKKYSFNPPLSLLLFFYFNCKNAYFVGLRQIIGYSFLLWAFIYCLNNYGQANFTLTDGNKKYKFLIVLSVGTLVGYFFHTSIIIYGILFIFLFLLPIKSRIFVCLLILVSDIFGIILGKFDILWLLEKIYGADMSSVERLSGYLLNTELNETKGIFWVHRYTIVGLVSLYFLDKRKINNILSKLFFVGIILNNLLSPIPMMSRFLPLLLLFGCVVFTWTFEKQDCNDRIKIVLSKVAPIFVVLYLTLGAFVEISKWDPNSDGKMHPYYFIFENYPDHE